MGTRITPFGDHPDGGTIKQFAVGEEMSDYILELSLEAVEILENVPLKERNNYILRSTEPELFTAREALKEKLRIVRAKIALSNNLDIARSKLN